MSGFEVVGVVLGGLPLIISCLEHYTNGVKKITAALGAVAEFKRVSRKLRAQEQVFRNTLELLITDCIDIGMQKVLMHDLGGQEWQRPEIEEVLKSRLQKSYSTYAEHVKSIEQSILKLRESLHIDEHGKVPFDDKFAFRQAYKRLRFALKLETTLNLIREIKSDNASLDKLTTQAKDLQTARRAGNIPDFEKIRSSATRIYQTLKQGLQVSCGASYKASICLPNSLTDAASSMVVGSSRPGDSFRIVLHHNVHPKQAVLQWSLEEAEIRLIDAATSSSPAVATSPIFVSTSACGTKRRKVQFQTAASSSVTVTKPNPSAPQTQEIQDLCHSIQKSRSTQCGICLGYMKCISSQHRYELYWPKKRLLDQASLSVETLDSVMEKKAQFGLRFTNADARKLAVPLALGMLRLHDTPWLNQSWSKRDVTLISQNGRVLAEYPFVSQIMIAGTVQPKSSATAPSGMAASMIRNQTLFSLGIILIELCMEKPISELHEPHEKNSDGTKHELSDFMTATRLLRMEEISDKFGQRWSDVVRRCIRCDLNQTKTSLEDIGFRKAVYHEVLAELEADNRHFFKLA